MLMVIDFREIISNHMQILYDIFHKYPNILLNWKRTIPMNVKETVYIILYRRYPL